MKYILFITSLTLLSFNSCKKGDEDPALSLLSRKARLTGVWELQSYNYDGVSADGFPITGVSDGSTMERTLYFGINEVIWDTLYTNAEITEYSFTINKDGTWERVIALDMDTERKDHHLVETRQYTTYEIQTGKWSFLNKSKGDYKNKERVLFDQLYDSIYVSDVTGMDDYRDPLTTDLPYFEEASHAIGTCGFGDCNFIQELLMLKSKEMKWFKDRSSSETSVTGLGTTVYSYEGEETYVWKKK